MLIEKTFSAVAPVQSVRVVRETDTAEPTPFAFVSVN